ncbi:MAG: hypothetical protein GY708_21655, partial [Actinomycetia bacterium]|nr:hypothetical protein [Actinomycetes bacterium]
SQTYTALCTGNGGATGQASVIVTVLPPVTATLLRDLAAFPLGGSALLTWDSTSANSCTGTNFVTGSLVNGSVVVTPVGQGSQQYDLQCDGNGGASASTSVTIDVGPPISVSLTANPDFIALGGTSSLDWTSTDATICSGDIFSTGGLTSGSAPVTPVADATYNVTCTGAGGATGAGSATVTVGPPVTTTLTADFETIALGGSSTLTWSSANADTCTASSVEDLAFSGDLATAGGNRLVTPTLTSTYTIACVGPGNAVDSSNITVTVGPPVVANLSADFTFIAQGGSSLLTWTSSNAISCTGTNFSTGGNTNSSQSVSPNVNTTYTLTCVGLGNAIETAQVTVDVGPPVVADLTSDLVFIALGGSAELSWTGSGGATSCTGDGSYSTGGALTGTATVSPTVTTVYGLTCNGPGNAADISSVTVTVGPAPTALLTSNFSAIPLGGTVQLNWTSENATSCTSADFSTGGNVGGVANVTPLAQGDTPYTLTCDAPGGATAQSVFIVSVGPPVSATISEEFSFIASGGASDLTWSSTSANSCSGNIFSTGTATAGTINVAPTVTSTYTLTCVGDGGAVGSHSTTIVVGPAVTASIIATPTFIALGGTSTLSWVGAGGATSCDDDLQFVTGGALVGTDAVIPSVNTTYTLTCHGAGNAIETAQVTVDVGPPVVVDLTATLPEVAPGGTSTLTWTTTGPATTCTGDLFLTGGALNGSADVVPAADTTYTVTCLGPGGVVEESQVTVTLGPPVTATLTSNLPSVPLGGTVNLMWSSANATSCSSPEFSTGGAISGTTADSPTDTIVYTVTCVGLGGGSGSANTSVTVGDAVAATLTATLDSIALGGSTTLTWSSGNATLGCTGTGFSTGGAESGSVVVSPSSTTTYFVQCDGAGGTSATSSDQVSVDPALSATLAATPTFIASGGSSTLSWSSVSATSCSGDNFGTGGNPTGLIVVSPTSDTTYTLTCTRAGSSDVASSATVTVGPPVQASLSSEFTAIALGGSSVLTWSSENATSCVASSVQDPGGWSGGRVVGGGALAVSPTETSVYDLTCTRS